MCVCETVYYMCGHDVGICGAQIFRLCLCVLRTNSECMSAMCHAGTMLRASSKYTRYYYTHSIVVPVFVWWFYESLSSMNQFEVPTECIEYLLFASTMAQYMRDIYEYDYYFRLCQRQ